MGQNRMKFWLCHAIYRHRQKQTSIKTDRQAKKGRRQNYRQTDRQTDRQTEIETYRENESQTDRLSHTQ